MPSNSSASSCQFTLPPESLAQAFPFHFVFDHTCRIVQAGSALQKLVPNIVGALLAEQFQLQRPPVTLDFATINKRSKYLFLFKSLTTNLVFRGQVLPLEKEQLTFFLGSPLIRSVDSLKVAGLKLKDFAIHDSIADFLILLTSKDDLTHELQRQKDKLKQAVKEKEEIAEKAEEKARDRAQEAEQALKKLKETQVKLIQTEKMSALGQMVAGIAHEINNPLNFIAGNITHLEGYAEDLMEIASHCDKNDAYGDPSLREQLENVEIEFLLEDLPSIIQSLKSGAKRIKDSVLALRKFSRLDNQIVDTVDLHEGIEGALRVLAHKLEHKINIKKDYGTLPLVKCYPALLNQVFRHILANAADALLESERREKVIRIGTGLNTQ
ncbi:MAG: histidine kinase, partial [Cyanobacteria bacterium P01_F01_bin.153]